MGVGIICKPARGLIAEAAGAFKSEVHTTSQAMALCHGPVDGLPASREVYIIWKEHLQGVTLSAKQSILICRAAQLIAREKEG